MKFWKKIGKRLRKFSENSTLNLGESLQKIYGISKLILRTFRSKNFRKQ